MRSYVLLVGVIGVLLLAGAFGNRDAGPPTASPLPSSVPTEFRIPSAISTAHTAALTLSAVAKPSPGDVGATLHFYGNVSGGSPPYSFNWSFGDDTFSGAEYPTHSYSTADIFTVVFSATSTCCAMTNATIHVRIYPVVSTQASYFPHQPTTSSVVNFTATPTDGTRPYIGFWMFGDGTTSTGLSVLHTYHTAGSYVAHLWANDSGGGSASTTLVVNVTGPPTGAPAAGPSAFLWAGAGVGVAAVLVAGGLVYWWSRARRTRLPPPTPPGAA